MSETVNQENQEQATEQGKTFTQAELDAIVGDRLKRDRAKYADYEDLKKKAERLDELEEAAKTDLQKATERADSLQKQINEMKAAGAIRDMREAVAKETGVPADLLTGGTEEACKEQAANILAFKGEKANYPAVKDGGGVGSVGKPTVRDQFAEWAEKQLK